MKITIEGREFEAFEGETILDVARRNEIQIPTICFLSGCSPTLACKMCMVEVGGKRAYSCNAKVKDGMEVVVHNEELQKDRNEIMESYCVNHPLECGVCDKSGECELQDFTLYAKVDTQKFGLQEADKKSYSFAQSFYDPALCIMCERCVTTCKDNIGEANLKVGKAKLFTPDQHKDSMGKDPYSVWAKRQKGLIEFVGKNECKDCGECISVCPVGAMTYKDFTYTSNAWELEKVQSTCGFCPVGCELTYNLKYLDVKGDLQKVYRVQNDYLYNPICGAGRFAFDPVSIGTRDLAPALEAFRKADCLVVGSGVSNEEALLANLIATKLGLPLVNREARLYRIFSTQFLRASGLYGEMALDSIFASLEEVRTSPVLVSLDTYFKYETPALRYKINNNLKMVKNSQLISIAAFRDSLLQGLGKGVVQIVARPDTASRAGILGLVLANDLIDSFEEQFPFALGHFLRKAGESSTPMDAPVEASADLDSKAIETLEAKAPPSNIESKEASEASGEDSKEDSKPSNTANPPDSKVDNLSPYDLSPLLEALGLEDLSALKLAKKGGVLLISQSSLEEFVASELGYLGGYGIKTSQSASNPPSIAEAVSATIAEDLTKEVASELMDSATKLEILANLLAFLCQNLGLKLLYVPKGANVLGVANLCALSNEEDLSPGYAVGLRARGDFVLDANLPTTNADFPLPTIAQSEGSLTNMEGRVLALHPSVAYLDSNLESAFDLGDLARALGVLEGEALESSEYLGDFTRLLGAHCVGDFAYRDIPYSDLTLGFERDGRDERGYKLRPKKEAFSKAALAVDLKFSLRLDSKESLEDEAKASSIPALKLETQNHFDLTTLASENLQSRSGIYASAKLLENLGLSEGALVSVHNDGGEVYAPIYCDPEIEGSILLVSPLLAGVDSIFGRRFHARVGLEAMQEERIG